MKRRNDKPEERLHMAVAHYLALQGRISGFVWYHTPNGQVRSIGVARKLKRMGVRPGVPDFTLIGIGGRVYFVELKAFPSAALSKDQKAFVQDVLALGAECGVARSLADVETLLADWGLVRRGGKNAA